VHELEILADQMISIFKDWDDGPDIGEIVVLEKLMKKLITTLRTYKDVTRQLQESTKK
jgi:hypothetical protein